MALMVQCFHCSNILELDEGFRGGVCRCSQCGALLQVPKATPGQGEKVRPATPPTPGQGQQVRPGEPVSEPGLSRGVLGRPAAPLPPPSSAASPVSQGMRTPGENPPGSRAVSDLPNRKPPTESPPYHGGSVEHPARPELPSGYNQYLWIFGGVMVLLMIGVAVGMLFLLPSLRGEKGTKPETGVGVGSTVLTSGPRTVEVPNGPAFLGIPMTGKKIVLSIDTGSSFRDRGFEYVLLGVRQAVGTLAADQSLRLALWEETGVRLVPEAGFVPKDRRTPILEALDSLVAQGATSEIKCIKGSLESGADQVIIVTAKLTLGSDTSATDLMQYRRTNQRVDVVRVLSPESELMPALEQLTNLTNGKFLVLDQGQLDALTKKP